MNQYEYLQMTQARLVDVLAGSYGIALQPTGFAPRDAVSPRWQRLPFLLQQGEMFENVYRQKRQIAQIAGSDVCDVYLEGGVLWLAFPRPKEEIEKVHLEDAMGFLPRPGGGLWCAVGVDMRNQPVAYDLTDSSNAHLLIAGVSGSGKTVFQNVLVASACYWYGPHLLNVVLCDAKGAVKANDGFGVFGGPQARQRLVHLMPYPVLTEIPDMIEAIHWAARLMDMRQKEGLLPTPRILFVIDELADVMLLGGAAVEEALQRLLWKGRSAGIHVVAATARVDKNSIGRLASLFKKRAVFTVPRATDAYLATNVGGSGAHLLLMDGDMLWGVGDRYRHLQGYFIDDAGIVSLLGRKGRFASWAPETVPVVVGAERNGGTSLKVPYRPNGRPLSEVTSVEVEQAVAYFREYGKIPTIRQVALGNVTGKGMGQGRAKRVIEAAASYIDKNEKPLDEEAVVFDASGSGDGG